MYDRLFLLIITVAAYTSQKYSHHGKYVTSIQSSSAKVYLNVVYRLCLLSAPADVTISASPTDFSSTITFTVEVIEIDVHEVIVELQRIDEDTGWNLTSITIEWLATMKPGLRNCKDFYNIGHTYTGLYTIYPDGNNPLKVYCDMTTQGGGWTVIMRRQSGRVDFNQSWVNYTQGFGDKNDDFWLGLNAMHLLTSIRNVELRIDLKACNNITFAAEYSSFLVGTASSNYKLDITGFGHQNDTICDYSNPQDRRNCGYANITRENCLSMPGCCFSDSELNVSTCFHSNDSMAVSNKMQFSTYDKDNDLSKTRNCAEETSGGFWFRACARARLTSIYAPCKLHGTFAIWLDHSGPSRSRRGFLYMDMKIRPR